MKKLRKAEKKIEAMLIDRAELINEITYRDLPPNYNDDHIKYLDKKMSNQELKILERLDLMRDILNKYEEDENNVLNVCGLIRIKEWEEKEKKVNER